MIKSIDPATDRFLATLRDINTRLTRAEREVSSGKRVVDASDDPDVVSSLLKTRTALSRLDQVESNLSRVTTEVNAADQALQSTITLMDQVRTLGMTGAAGFQTAETRQSVADQIQSIEQRMVALANTQVDGRYIFSGDSDSTAAFTYNVLGTPPWGAYQGSVATREAMHPTGVTFRTGLDGQSVFANADPTKNVLLAVETMRTALIGGDQTQMNNALASLANASAHLNGALTFYGNVESQLSDATGMASKLTLRLKSEQADLQDADPTEAIVEMQQLKFTQDAAYSMRSKLPKTSLFDYMG